MDGHVAARLLHTILAETAFIHVDATWFKAEKGGAISLVIMWPRKSCKRMSLVLFGEMLRLCSLYLLALKLVLRIGYTVSRSSVTCHGQVAGFRESVPV